MEQTRAAPPTTAALVDAHRDGAEAATGLIEQAVSPNTRDAYAGALRRLERLARRPAARRPEPGRVSRELCTTTGRTPATAALVVAAVRRAAHDANENAPDGPLTRQTLEGFRRTAAAAGAPAHRSPARGLTAEECDAVLAACCRRRRTGSGLEREETAMRRGLDRRGDRRAAVSRRPAPQRSGRPALGRRRPVRRDDDVVVTVRRSKTNPAGDRADVRRLVGGCAAAVRRLHTAMSTSPTEAVIGLAVHQINRRFAAACAAAGLEGRRTSHSGRVGLAVELTARGASTHDVQLAGGWKDAGMVARYAASVSTRDGAVSRFMRETKTKP